VNDYFQYDYICVNDYFQYDYIRVNDYFPKAVRGTSLQRIVTASTLNGYTKQGPSTISMSNPMDNGAPVDSVNRPAFGYILNLFCVFLFEFYLRFNLNTCTCFVLTGSLIFVMNLLIISGIKMYRKLHNYLTIQKHYLVDRLSVASFAATLKPNVFDGSNCKRWKQRVTYWLTTMSIMHVIQGKPEQFSPEEKAFEAADNLFLGAILSVLAENLVDTYLLLPSGKDIWDALEAKFGVSNAGGELYVMEQLYDYKMVEDRSVVEQAHEIQALARDLENYSKDAPCKLTDKFVAGGIISKLPPSWKEFGTSLKHKRQEFVIVDLIDTLDVEEKARAKDKTHGKGIVGSSSANLVQKKNNNAFKKKNKPHQNQSKAKQTTQFK
jgi:hypothetical protein